MNSKTRLPKFVLMTIVATLLSTMFVFLGAPIIRVIRNIYGALLFWTAGAFVVASFLSLDLFPMAFLITGLWLTIGLYSEVEERGWAGFHTAFLSVLLGTGAMVGGTLAWSKYKQIGIAEILSKNIEGFLNQAKMGAKESLIPGFSLDVQAVMGQIPSLVFLLLLSGLAFALMLDRKTALLFNVPFEKISSQMRLLEFRTPDYFIWITMISFLLSFLKLPAKEVSIVSLNVFNTAMGIYFFQGLAVLEVLLIVLRAGTILRFLVYFLIVGQLFFVLSAVGLIDFWADFRKRFRTMRNSVSKQKNGEQI